MRISTTALALMALLGLAACGDIAPTHACEEYVACIDARDQRDGTSTNVDRFLPGGTCWSGAEGAEACDRACGNGLAWLVEVESDAPEACVHGAEEASHE